uniref:Immunity protein n=1 Tax=Hirondellea gigas TaxID=1518452 RepID=A0A2P2IAG4_9CRUS
MKMTKCKACNKDIAKGVKKCVHCGKDQRGFFMRHKFLSGFMILILISILGGALDENEQSSSNNQTVPRETVSNNVPREYMSALKKAKTYAATMNMSKIGVYNQLISEYGEKFPVEAAEYAMENISFNWKQNALKKARTYANTMDMSNSAIYEQLISEYGENFTKEEAQYAIDNLK